MSKDAKLGLVLGIGLVIVIAVVFFRKDPVQGKAMDTAAAVKPKTALAAPASDSGRRHTVVEGDTLVSIAERYFSNRSKFIAIYQANEDLLPDPGRLEPGTVLVIPDL